MNGKIRQELIHQRLKFIRPFLTDLLHSFPCFCNRHREDLDAEFLHQFVFIDHHAGERQRSVAQLQNAHMLPVFQHTGNSRKIREIPSEHFRVHPAGRNLSELHMITLKKFGQCKQAALPVQHPFAVLRIPDILCFGNPEFFFLR